jgi:carboxyl-terminal processing protease
MRFFEKMGHLMRSSKMVQGTLVLAVLAGVAGTTTDGSRLFEMAKQIEIYTNLYRELNSDYVDEVDPAKLMRTGMEAMTASLDPFTNYIAEADIEGYRLIAEGHYSGIGATYQMVDGIPTVIEILNDSPAQKSGLKVGDRIATVGGRTTVGRSIEDMNAFLRGAVGTDILLGVEQKGKAGITKITLTRAELAEQNVPYSGMLRDGIAYIHLSTFTRQAAGNVGDALVDLKKKGELKGLVLDLRGNGGGLLDEAVKLVNLFVVKNESIVSMRGRNKEDNHVFKGQSDPIDLTIPIAVLVDKHSASSSEIVSGALQDLDRAVIIGQRTYGKGLVQHTRDIGYNSMLKLTTAKYYIPSGRCIQSVKYENGKPVNIPDSLRATFATRSGRTVLDGGGIKPDIVLASQTDAGLFKDLTENYWIFKFANDFVAANPMPAEIDGFRFTDTQAFVDYLKANKYEYVSESRKLVRKAIEVAKTDGTEPATIALLEQQERSLGIDFASVLNKNRDVLINLIEKELAGRSHFLRGKVQIGLRNDPAVEQAITTLLNPTTYNGLLRK